MSYSGNRLQKLRAVTEVTANLLLIIALVVGSIAWVVREHATRTQGLPSTLQTARGPVVGEKIALPGVNWAKGNSTLVVAISSACQFCIQSTPFYSKLTRSGHATPVVFVMPQSVQEAQSFLQEHEILPNSTLSSDLAVLNVEATPTILLVSNRGSIEKSWVGELSKSQQIEVMNSLDKA